MPMTRLGVIIQYAWSLAMTVLKPGRDLHLVQKQKGCFCSAFEKNERVVLKMWAFQYMQLFFGINRCGALGLNQKAGEFGSFGGRMWI